jgi:hypothetical protein
VGTSVAGLQTILPTRRKEYRRVSLQSSIIFRAGTV